MRRLRSTLLFLALAATASAAPSLVSLRLEYYAVDQAQLTPLLAAPSSSSDSTKLRQHILALIPEQSAELVDSAYITARSGQRAKLQSVVEWPYPTEHIDPGIPQRPAGPDKKETPPPPPIISTGAKVTDLGLTIEVDPTVSPDGQTIELNLAPQYSVRTGDTAAKSSAHPVLHTLKNSHSISVRSGTWVTLGLYDPPESNRLTGTHQIIALLHAQAQHPGNADTAEISRERSEVYQKFHHPAEPFSAEHPPDPGAEPDWLAQRYQIAILTEWIETDAITATKLLDKHAAPYADATQLRSSLLALIAKKKATLRDHAYVVTRSGQRAKSHSAREIPVPKGTYHPVTPKKISGLVDPSVRTTTHASLKPFEFRDVGPALEVDPIVATDHLTIELNIAPDLVSHPSDITLRHGASSFTCPVFHTVSPHTSILLHHGVPALLAMASPCPADVT